MASLAINRMILVTCCLAQCRRAFAWFGAWTAHADIKIGFQAPLSGFAATDGKSAKIAAEMASRGHQQRRRRARPEARARHLRRSGQVGSGDLHGQQADRRGRREVCGQRQLLGLRPRGRAACSRRPASRSSPPTACIPTSPPPAITPSASSTLDRRRARDRLVHRQEARLQDASPRSPWITTTARRRWTASWRPLPSTGSRSSTSTATRCRIGSSARSSPSVKRDNPDAIYATGYFFTGGPLVAQLRAAGVTAADHRLAGLRL